MPEILQLTLVSPKHHNSERIMLRFSASKKIVHDIRMPNSDIIIHSNMLLYCREYNNENL